MALINCELLRQAVFLYVSMLGFIVVQMGNSLFGTTSWPDANNNATSHVTHINRIDDDGSGALAPDDGGGRGQTSIIGYPNDYGGYGGVGGGDYRDFDTSYPLPVQPPQQKPDADRPPLATIPPNLPWEKLAKCQNLYQSSNPTPIAQAASPIVLLERFNAGNMSIPLSDCSTIHLKPPLSSLVWCGVTEPRQQVMEEVRTLAYFLSRETMDVVIVEGGGHLAGISSLVALSVAQESSVHVISPYMHYLGTVEKSVLLSKLPTPRLFLYHNQISEIRGKVNLAYMPREGGVDGGGYSPDCKPSGPTKPTEESDISSSSSSCYSEVVSTATMDQASNSLRYSIQLASPPPDSPTEGQPPPRRPLLVRATFTNIHQVNGFLDSPDMFSSWCIKLLILDASLLGEEDRRWLGKRLTRMGYNPYTLGGNPWTLLTSDELLTVWTTAPFTPQLYN